MMKLYDPVQIGGLVHMVLTRIKDRQLLLTVDEIASVVEMCAENFDKVLERVDKIEAKYEKKEDVIQAVDLEMEKILDELINKTVRSLRSYNNLHEAQETVLN